MALCWRVAINVHCSEAWCGKVMVLYNGTQCLTCNFWSSINLFQIQCTKNMREIYSRFYFSSFPLSYYSSFNNERNFLVLLIKKFRGFIVFWESIVINPLATIYGDEYLSKNSEVIRALKLQYSRFCSSYTSIFLYIYIYLLYIFIYFLFVSLIIQYNKKL